MSTWHGFSSSRWLGILIKEFIQLKRDRLTFGMIMGIPIMLLMLFGFAINTDPKHLPTAVVMSDPGPFARAYVSAMENSTYFKIVGQVDEHQAMRHLIRLLDPQPVKKEGWMVVWNRGNTSSVFSTEEEAKEWYGYPKVCEGKVVKVTWEE